MSLISLEFYIFFTIVAVVCFVTPAKYKWFPLFLGTLYYVVDNSAWYQAVNFLVFLIINYIISVNIKKSPVVYKAGLVFDVLYLFAFKYFGFFTGILKVIFRSADFSLLNYAELILNEYAPMGLSYFNLIVIAYLTDVYWEKTEALKNPLKFGLYSGFFPLLTSGPIVAYENYGTGLFGNSNFGSFKLKNLTNGAFRVLYGIFKKLVIAERLAKVVNTIYGDFDKYHGFYVPVAAALFAFQLYTDFSGLMDIVLGLSEILGLSLPENFDTPFYSLNLSEFWRRWHITLGGFLRDYVLYPVQRSKGFKDLRKFCKNKFGKGYEKKFNLPLYLSLFVSWFLIGLWHGGGWNYIIGVGLYMWLVICLSDILKPAFEKLVTVLNINTECFSFRMFQRIRTFMIFSFGLSFFRAETLNDAIKMWQALFKECNIWIFFDKSLYELGLSLEEWIIAIVGLLVVFVVSYVKQSGDVREKINNQNYIFKVLLFIVLLCTVITYGYYGTGFESANFIYGRF